MTIVVKTKESLYIFDNAEEIYVKEENLEIKQSEEDLGRGFIIRKQE